MDDTRFHTTRLLERGLCFQSSVERFRMTLERDLTPELYAALVADGWLTVERDAKGLPRAELDLFGRAWLLHTPLAGPRVGQWEILPHTPSGWSGDNELSVPCDQLATWATQIILETAYRAGGG